MSTGGTVALYDQTPGNIANISSGNLNTALWAWQTSTLSWVKLSTDVSGNLNVTGSGGGGGGTVTQGPAASLSGAWPIEVTDGTNGPAAIKPPSTAAIAADPGLVVCVSPNNSVAVTGTFWPATQPVSGTVSVGNFPATQPVSGTVSVGNFPATQPVSGTFWQTIQPVSAASLPLPAGAATLAEQQTINTTLGSPMQQTGGSLSVTNLPATQPVSGAVSVSNFPATQPVSAVALPLPANAAQETSGNLAAILGIEQTSVLPLLQQILVELRVITTLLGSGLNVKDDPDSYRNDPSFSQVN